MRSSLTVWNPYHEALLNVPVAYALHDGVLIDSERITNTLYISSAQVPQGIYPSQLTPLAHTLEMHEVVTRVAARNRTHTA
jgi:hypothetical protein